MDSEKVFHPDAKKSGSVFLYFFGHKTTKLLSEIKKKVKSIQANFIFFYNRIIVHSGQIRAIVRKNSGVYNEYCVKYMVFKVF